MMKLQFEASDGKNILWGEDGHTRIYAEIEVPEGASEDYGYITMKKAILAELDKMGKNLDMAFWYDGQEQFLADDADVDADVDVDIELEEEGL